VISLNEWLSRNGALFNQSENSSRTKNLELPRPEKPGVVSFGTALGLTGKAVQPLCAP